MYIADAPLDCSTGDEGLSGCKEKALAYNELGNSSTCEVRISSEIIGRENQYNRVDPRSRLNISSVAISLVIECISKKNLIQALYGVEKKTDIESKEENICFCRCFDPNEVVILSETPVDDSLDLFLKDAFGNILSELVLGVDYTLEGNKIVLIGAESFDEKGITLLAQYDFETNSRYELNALKASPKYKDIYFIGENAASDQKEKLEARFFRVLLRPLDSFDLLSKGQLFNLPLEGVVEESSKGWFKIKLQGEEDGEFGGIVY